MSVSASTSFTKGTAAQIFGGEECLLLPGALSFEFSYVLDLCSQGQAAGAFFIGMCFSLILSKVQGAF